MKEPKNVLAFDFGASGGRAILGSRQGDRIVMQETHRFSNDPVTVHGTMYWDTLRQLHEIKQGILRTRKYGSVSSIGIDTWGVDFGLLDRHGALMENGIHYRDRRTNGMPENLFRKISRERLYEITGTEFNYFNTVFQLNALTENRPWMPENAGTLLFTPDLFNYFLTGEKHAEFTIAATSALLDLRRREWSDEVLKAVGIRKDILPDLVMPGTPVGTLTPEICEELGVLPCQVTAVASHDTQSASAAVPSDQKDFIFLSCGTWSLYGTELDQPVINDRSRELSISNEGGYGGRINFLKNLTGLWMIQESRRQWIREGQEYSFSELEQLAGKAEPFLSYVDADDPLFVDAGNMPRRIRDYCSRTGQPIPDSPGDIVRCVNQSLALRYRLELEKLEYCLGRSYDTIHMIGGGIQSRMLCQMTANATGRKVIAGPVEATALGNIAVQLISLGEIQDITEARELISRSEQTVTYEPQDIEAWEEAYRRYRDTIQPS